jgi:hypothetical protein
MNVGDVFFGRRIRQNHALEHAAVTILTAKITNLRISARSSPQGFVIFGNVGVDKVRAAAEEALERLQAGEVKLAIHPNCGTNVAVGALLTVVSWVLTLMLVRSRARVLFSLLGVMAAGLIARPIGAVVQRYVTTLPDLHGVYITGISRRSYLSLSVIEVQTAQG